MGIELTSFWGNWLCMVGVEKCTKGEQINWWV